MKSKKVVLTRNLLVHDPKTETYSKGQVFDLSLDTCPEIIRRKFQEGKGIVVVYERVAVEKPYHTVVSPGHVEIQGGLREFKAEPDAVNSEMTGSPDDSDSSDAEEKAAEASTSKIKLKTK